MSTITRQDLLWRGGGPIALVYRSIASLYCFALKETFPCSFISSAVGPTGFSCAGDSTDCAVEGERGLVGFDWAPGWV